MGIVPDWEFVYPLPVYYGAILAAAIVYHVGPAVVEEHAPDRERVGRAAVVVVSGAVLFAPLLLAPAFGYDTQLATAQYVFLVGATTAGILVVVAVWMVGHALLGGSNVRKRA